MIKKFMTKLKKFENMIKKLDNLESITKKLDDLETMTNSIRVHTWHGHVNALGSIVAMIGAQDGRYADPLRLSRHLSQVYSQSCEDGFIAEIFRRIGVKSRTFLEIGVENGQQNTTRFLLEQGWRGYWVEGSISNANSAKEIFSDYVKTGALVIINAFITAENINEILNAYNAPSTFDFLSLDIDQNTSHVWRALSRKARACCIEYNASLPPSVDIQIPYDPQGSWDGSNWYGGSLKTLEHIGKEKGLSLVGCDFLGLNAYFVAENEAAGHFRAPFTAENHYELPKYHLLSHQGHLPSKSPKNWGSYEHCTQKTPSLVA